MKVFPKSSMEPKSLDLEGTIIFFQIYSSMEFGNIANFLDLFFCSFPCPYYQKVPLSLALSPRIISEIARFKPDIIHASSPGIMVLIVFF